MIKVTKLNGKQFFLNAVYIEQVESFPDTTITLTDGKIFVVKEPIKDVIIEIMNYYRSVSILGLNKDTEGLYSEKE